MLEKPEKKPTRRRLSARENAGLLNAFIRVAGLLQVHKSKIGDFVKDMQAWFNAIDLDLDSDIKLLKRLAREHRRLAATLRKAIDRGLLCSHPDLGFATEMATAEQIDDHLNKARGFGSLATKLAEKRRTYFTVFEEVRSHRSGRPRGVSNYPLVYPFIFTLAFAAREVGVNCTPQQVIGAMQVIRPHVPADWFPDRVHRISTYEQILTKAKARWIALQSELKAFDAAIREHFARRETPARK
jgi:hypothetical protein